MGKNTEIFNQMLELLDEEDIKELIETCTKKIQKPTLNNLVEQLKNKEEQKEEPAEEQRNEAVETSERKLQDWLDDCEQSEQLSKSCVFEETAEVHEKERVLESYMHEEIPNRFKKHIVNKEEKYDTVKELLNEASNHGELCSGLDINNYNAQYIYNPLLFGRYSAISAIRGEFPETTQEIVNFCKSVIKKWHLISMMPKITEEVKYLYPLDLINQAHWYLETNGYTIVRKDNKNNSPYIHKSRESQATVTCMRIQNYSDYDQLKLLDGAEYKKSRYGLLEEAYNRDNWCKDEYLRQFRRYFDLNVERELSMEKPLKYNVCGVPEGDGSTLHNGLSKRHLPTGRLSLFKLYKDYKQNGKKYQFSYWQTDVSNLNQSYSNTDSEQFNKLKQYAKRNGLYYALKALTTTAFEDVNTKLFNSRYEHCKDLIERFKMRRLTSTVESELNTVLAKLPLEYLVNNDVGDEKSFSALENLELDISQLEGLIREKTQGQQLINKNQYRDACWKISDSMCSFYREQRMKDRY